MNEDDEFDSRNTLLDPFNARSMPVQCPFNARSMPVQCPFNARSMYAARPEM
jgi:hypothetical protein